MMRTPEGCEKLLYAVKSMREEEPGGPKFFRSSCDGAQFRKAAVLLDLDQRNQIFSVYYDGSKMYKHRQGECSLVTALSVQSNFKQSLGMSHESFLDDNVLQYPFWFCKYRPLAGMSVSYSAQHSSVRSF